MRNFAKVLSVTVIIALLFTLGGCSALTKKITDEAKTKISEQLEETDDEDAEDTEDTEAADETEADATEAEDTEAADDNTNGDSTAITTSAGKSMDWPTENMGDVTPVSCKISAVFTDGSNGSVTFEGMERKEADNYIAEFESLGYTTAGAITEDEAGVFFINTNEAGDSIWFSYAPDGTGLISFTAAS